MEARNPDARPGEVFDAVAEAYDQERPGYPAELIDAACAIGKLGEGSRVLEIGCGTGQLTEALVDRGLAVDAVDPGANMIALARRRAGDAVSFCIGRFEDVALPASTFDAAFSATAFHWVDPSVGWAKVAGLLRPGGVLALLMHIGYLNEATAEEDEELHRVFERHLPPDGISRLLRDLPTLRAGFDARADDVSAVWTWLGHHDLTTPAAAELFRDLRLVTKGVVRELTPAQLWALFQTTSTYPRLDASSRGALEHELRATFRRFGGTLRTSDLAVLVTAHARA